MQKHISGILMLLLALNVSVVLAHDESYGHDMPDIGQPGQVKNASRTINVELNDAMRFVPDNIKVRQGETIRIVVKNIGKVRHELVLGTEKMLKEHDELMQKFPGMEHEEPNMVSVAGGQAGELIRQFSKSGRIDFACLQPGHYAAGMKGAVLVEKRTGMPEGGKITGQAGQH